MSWRSSFSRIAAPASAGALAVSLLLTAPMGVAAGSTPHVTFSATPVVGTVLGHWTVDQSGTSSVSNAARAATSKSHAAAEPPELLPKAVDGLTGAKAPVSDMVANGNGGNDARTRHPLRSFIGQQGSNITCSYFPKGCNPPDMAIAASPTRVLQGVNSQFTVYDTSGHPLVVRSAQSFFGIPSNTCDPDANGQPFVTDPRALYDPSTGRFWAAMLQLEGALGVGGNCPLLTAYFVAVSQTHDPAGVWNVYEFDMSLGTTNVADFTQMGLSATAVFFSANMFNQEGTVYEGAEIFEANKSQMQAGMANFTPDGFFGLTAHGPAADYLADTVQPALNLDHLNSGFFVDTFNGLDPVSGNLCGINGSGPCQGLALWRMDNPTGHDRGGPAPRLVGVYVPGIKPYAFAPAANQPGCNQCVDANDLRIPGTPVVRNGNIYTAWGTALRNGTAVIPGIEWAIVNLHDAPEASGETSGYYTFNDHNAVSYPAVMPDRHGSLTMVFEAMGPHTNPQTRYIVKSASMRNFAGRGVLIKAGEAPYRPGVCATTAVPVCRWGDYEAATFDGSGRIWLAGEYANSFTDPNAPPVFGRNWGTWIVAVPS